jgi:hypothetical protein
MNNNALFYAKLTLDKIRRYYLKGESSVKLSEKQDEIRIRVLKAWNLMINYLSKNRQWL